MPELPEVETTVRGIRKYAVGKKITDVWTDYKSSFHAGKENIKNPKYFSAFKKEIVGAKIIGSSRRAKNVIIHLSNKKSIVIHMKMTGHVMFGTYNFDPKKKKDPWTPLATEGPLIDPFNKFLHLVLTFSDQNQLVLSDMRKFAKVNLADDKELASESPFDASYGPEPLEKNFTFKIFEERLMLRPHWKIKQALMDQTLIAGIGNIYSDEILWRADVHPESQFESIPSKNRFLMFKAVKETLKKGIDFGGDSMSDYRNIKGERGKFQSQHQAYRRTGKTCNKKGCKGHIVRKKIGGRSAHFCDTHQELFK